MITQRVAQPNLSSKSHVDILSMLLVITHMNLGLQLYRGENTIKHFLKKLMDASDKIKELLKIEKPMIITPEQEEEFLKCETCHICEGKIDDTSKSLRRVRDHDHYN